MFSRLVPLTYPVGRRVAERHYDRRRERVGLHPRYTRDNGTRSNRSQAYNRLAVAVGAHLPDPFSFAKQLYRAVKPICAKRQERKEVLFAMGRGGSNPGPRRRVDTSDVRCK